MNHFVHFDLGKIRYLDLRLGTDLELHFKLIILPGEIKHFSFTDWFILRYNLFFKDLLNDVTDLFLLDVFTKTLFDHPHWDFTRTEAWELYLVFILFISFVEIFLN